MKNAVNRLTNAELDSTTEMLEYQMCAVDTERSGRMEANLCWCYWMTYLFFVLQTSKGLLIEIIMHMKL